MENVQVRKRRLQMKKRRRQRFIRSFLGTLILMLFVSTALFAGSRVFMPLVRQRMTPMLRAAEAADDGRAETMAEADWNDAAFVDLECLYSPYAVLVDAVSGSVLAGRGGSERIYPASLTKIMTAILAIENTADLEQTICLNNEMFGPLYAQNASMAGFQPGETVRLMDLLYGVMLPSGAECCLAFAEQIAGSESGFAGMMNEKAEELGMENTHFTNATGLHDPEHYSTVEDISVLLRYALQNEVFRAAFTSSRYSMPPSDRHPYGITFQSTMFKYMDSAAVAGGEILGGKTGYTGEAGQCLASLARVGGAEYILVTAGAGGSHQTQQFHILDAFTVYNQIGACQNDL